MIPSNTIETNGTERHPTKQEPEVTEVVATSPQARELRLAFGNGEPISDYQRPLALCNKKELLWDEDAPPIENYMKLGQNLAAAGDLYRQPGYASGLLMGSSQPNIEPVPINKGSRLASIIIDRVRVSVTKNGNSRGNQIAMHHLNTMLATEAFLQCFRPIDAVVRVPSYLPDFQLPKRGYNDGGFGQRLLYVGPEVQVADTMDAINAFLDVMAFATPADRANAVALAITVLLRFFWPGAKPVGVVTSTKSHGGKDTVISFAAGSTPKVSVDYESTDWAFRQGLIACLKARPDAGVVNVENARLGRGDKFVASAVLERFLTDPEPVIHSTKLREPLRIKNHLVLAISTNYGTVSEDLMNRALPIHLNPVGNVADRKSPIGNPKLEYLPANRERIEAELRGMVERWKLAGRPLNKNVRHPFTDWAHTVGGILQFSDFKGFLDNYSLRRTADDPLRKALGQLGAYYPDQWQRADDWARQAILSGFGKQVIPERDRDTDKSRERGIGVVLSAHQDETFEVETDDNRVTLRLEKKRARFGGNEPSTRYRFAILKQEAIPEDIVPSSVDRPGQ